MFAGHLILGIQPTAVPQASQAVGPVSFQHLLNLMHGQVSWGLDLTRCLCPLGNLGCLRGGSQAVPGQALAESLVLEVPGPQASPAWMAPRRASQMMPATWRGNLPLF